MRGDGTRDSSVAEHNGWTQARDDCCVGEFGVVGVEGIVSIEC